MEKKQRLELMALTGSEKCFLEIEIVENGDMYVNMRGQDTRGEIHDISAQMPNPINGGGNPDKYERLRKIYYILKEQNKKIKSKK
jgi:hypothetical protein